MLSGENLPGPAFSHALPANGCLHWADWRKQIVFIGNVYKKFTEFIPLIF